MIVNSKRLQMAQISQKHRSLFYALHTDPEVISLCFDKPSDSEIDTKFESRLPPWSMDSSDWLCLVITETSTGEPIGITGFCLHNQIAEVGFMLLPKYQGLGYATESLNALLAYSHSTLGIHNYRAVVTQGNTSSERVLLKSGFTLEGIIPDAYTIAGNRYSDCIYQLSPSEI